jgi:arylsulfatase A-like enzyme
MFRRLFDSPWTWFGLSAALLVAAASMVVHVRFPTRPQRSAADIATLKQRGDVSVLFILIDTLRADRLGAYGYGRPTSPNLDRLAAEGIRFERVAAQSSWTKCSMASLWTGLFPVHTGVTNFHHALPEQAVLPAEVLEAAGFRTAGVWRNGWVAPNFGFGQGFETYVRPAATFPERFQHRAPAVTPIHGTDEDATRAAISFLDTYGRERFFLYVHYMDVHQYAYDQRSADLGFGSSYSDGYDSAINWVDRNVATLIRTLEDRGLADHTLVVVAADHGEGFLEHGSEGHARTLYSEVTNVPLILSLPFRLDRPVTVKPLVRNVDIWPTILDLLGLPPLPATDGRSLVPLIEAAASGAENPGDDPPAIGYLDRRWGRPEEKPLPLVSVRSDDHVLILGRAPDGDTEQVFDLSSDPTEQHDLTAEQPPWSEPLRTRALEALDAKPTYGPAPQVEVDRLMREQLRALGYIEK